MALFLFGIDAEDALFLEALAHDDFGCDIREGVARCLGEEGHRPRRTGVDLDDVNLFGLVHDELDVVKALDADAEAKLLGVLQDGPFHLVGDGEGGVDRDAVARVDTRTLDQFHDARHEDVHAVAHRVDFHFLTHDVAIHEHGLVLVDLHRGLEVMAKRLFVADDLHRPAAENEARADEYGVPDARRGFDAVLDLGHRRAFGARDVKLGKKFFKQVAVFRLVDRRAIGADDLDAAVVKRVGKVDGGLSAEGGDDAFRLLKIDDRHHVFGRERLKVQLVRRGVIGGNGLGVVVDDDGFVARALDGLHRVDGGIIELNALSDTDGAGAQNDELVFVCQAGLIFEIGVKQVFIGRIEVGDILARMQGVHHAEDRHESVFLAQVANGDLVGTPQTCDELIREAHGLSGLERFFVKGLCLQNLFHFGDGLHALEEQRGDHRHLVKLVDGNAAAQRLCDGKYAVRAELLQIRHDVLGGHIVKLLEVDVANARLQRADGF